MYFFHFGRSYRVDDHALRCKVLSGRWLWPQDESLRSLILSEGSSLWRIIISECDPVGRTILCWIWIFVDDDHLLRMHLWWGWSCVGDAPLLKMILQKRILWKTSIQNIKRGWFFLVYDPRWVMLLFGGQSSVSENHPWSIILQSWLMRWGIEAFHE